MHHSRGPVVRLLVDPTRLWWGLLVAIGLLHVISLVGHVLHKGLGIEDQWVIEWIMAFSVDHEQTLPTWFSVGMLAFIGFVAAEIAMAERQAASPLRWHWALISVVFFYISYDELASLHERVGNFLAARGLGGPFHYAWVVVAAPLALLFAVLMIRLLRSVPRRTAAMMALAGALYVGGALGGEIVTGVGVDAGYGPDTLVGQLLVVGEELLEMLGTALFLVTILRHRDRVIPLDDAVQLRQGVR